jgi:putative SOS response-associated peptidase YedK
MFAVVGSWQQKVAGFAMVMCDPNALVAPIHTKAMITILKPQDHGRWPSEAWRT